MTKRTVLICKIIDQTGWDEHDGEQTVKIINPFGKNGGIGGNDPHDVMVMEWSGRSGATYVFDHTDRRTYEKEKPENTVVISAKCGQEATLKLDDIDENQEITEVTIRGVTYVPK